MKAFGPQQNSNFMQALKSASFAISENWALFIDPAEG